MAGLSQTTWKDLIDHVVDYLGDNSTTLSVIRDARRATIDGLRELASAHRWSYYYCRGRLDTVAPYSTGTITYDHTGGAYERLVTLDSGTFPSWAALGQIVISNTIYQVAERKSSTTLTLSINSNPGDDVAAGTTYTLQRDTYALPHDFLASEEFINTSNFLRLQYYPPDVWLRRQRLLHSPSTPHIYTIQSSPDHFGCMAVSFFPPPDQVYHFDYLYQRRPRQLRISDYSAGTVSVTASSTTATGSGTSWTSDMVGSVFRLSSSATDLPTGLSGANPPVLERIVSDVASTTSLTLDSSATTTYSGRKYLISDPVDVEEGAMLTALFRAVEKQSALVRIMKNQGSALGEYRNALILAREADSRDFSRKSSMGGGDYYRMRDMPRGDDVS